MCERRRPLVKIILARNQIWDLIRVMLGKKRIKLSKRSLIDAFPIPMSPIQDMLKFMSVCECLNLKSISKLFKNSVILHLGERIKRVSDFQIGYRFMAINGIERCRTFDKFMLSKISNTITILEFMYLCTNGCTECVAKALNYTNEERVEGKINPSFLSNLPIRHASADGHVDLVRLLMGDKRVDPSASNDEPIRYASKNGHSAVVKELLKDKRVNPSVYYSEALRGASYNGYVEIVKLLLKDERVDPSAFGNLALKYAERNNHHSIVKLLLKYKDAGLPSNSCLQYNVYK